MKINFIKPKSVRGSYMGSDTLSKVTLSVGIKGKKRKTTFNTFSLRRLVKHYNLGWRYAQVGISDNGQIIVCSGNEDNGYVVGKANFEISNQLLNESLLKAIGYRVPSAADDSIRVDFTAVWDKESNVYILNPIN